MNQEQTSGYRTQTTPQLDAGYITLRIVPDRVLAKIELFLSNKRVFYDVDQDGNPMFVQEYDPTANNGQGGMVNTTERLVTKGLKSTETAAVKAAAGSLLASTDWMVIRKVERNVDVPAAVATYRAAVVAEADRLEAAIAAVANVDALAAVKANWPKA